MTLRGNLEAEERLTWMRKRLEADGKLRISSMAGELQVSEMTIRRDLQILESMGIARRVRGGAVAVGPAPFQERHKLRAGAKIQIAAKLAPLVPETGAIGVDASSTLLRLAASLEGARGLLVITNSIETLQALQDKPGVTGVLTGGSLDPRTGSLVGPIAARAARSLMLQRLFVSAAAVHPKLGGSETCLEEAEVKQAMAGVADEIVLAVDSSKLDSRAVAAGMGWEQISMLVTELDPSDPRLDRYRGLTQIR